MICPPDIQKLVREIMRAPHHLNALRAFEAAARHLSYVAAADELNVTPAAVGSLVRSLKQSSASSFFTVLRRAPHDWS
jgi:LysR family glycine cleavage system transcriptional activator